MGLFISFCGLDGSGKSTQAYMLNDYFKNKCNLKSNVALNFKPSTNTDRLKKISSNLTNNLYADFPSDVISLSLVSDLWRNISESVIPKLKSEEIIITERFSESLLVYGPLFGSNEKLLKKDFDIFPIPDVYFFLDLNPVTAYQRVIERSETSGIAVQYKETLPIMKKAARQYKLFSENACNVITLNIENLTAEEVHHKVISNLKKINFKCLNDISLN